MRPGAFALIVAITASALLPAVSWAEASPDAGSDFLADGVYRSDVSPSFGVLRGNSHLELFGAVSDVPAIVDATHSFGSRGEERAPTTVIVFINWRG